MAASDPPVPGIREMQPPSPRVEPSLANDAAERARRDRELSPSRAAKDAGGDIDAWLKASEAARRASGLRLRLDEAYGVHPRQRMDIWAPPAGVPARAVVAFVHGGFWQEGSKDFGGFPGPTLAAAGIIYAALGYRLAPEASLTEIVADIRLALERLSEVAQGLGIGQRGIIVAGHSAGAHLAASLLAGPGAPAPASLAGLVLVSGVYELAPIAASYVNEAVAMSEVEIADLSPARHRPMRDVPVSILAGAEEAGEFLRQSALLAEAWRPHLSSVEMSVLEGRDHFDIMHGLARPGDPLLEAVMRQAGGRTQP
jgi:arylformamidase